MNENTLTCPICTNRYDTHDHTPLIVPLCGHTICQTCLIIILKEDHGMFKCPYCKDHINLPSQDISFFPKNFILLDMIDTKTPTEFCTIHKSQLDLLCLDCRVKVCNKCVFNGDHKGHNVDLIENFISTVDAKCNQVQTLLQAHDQEVFAIESALKMKKQNALNQVDLAFNEQYQLLKEKFSQAKASINTLYSNNNQIPSLQKRNKLSELIQGWASSNKVEFGFQIQNLCEISVTKDANPSNALEELKKIPDVILGVSKESIQNSQEIFQIKFSNHPEEQKNSMIQSPLQNSEEIQMAKQLTQSLDNNPKQQTTTANQNRDLTIGPIKVNTKDTTIHIKLCQQNNKIISNQNIISQLQEIQHLNKVENCSISNDARQLTDEMINNLMIILWNLPIRLQQISMNFDSIKFQGESLGKIFSLLLSQASIRSLNLSFSNCVGLNASAFESLHSTLLMIPKISQFTLRFNSTSDLDEKGLNICTKLLECLRNLEKLSLEFSSCYKLTPTIFQQLCQSMKSLKKLQSIDLNLQKPTFLGAESYQYFSSCIEQVQTLDELDLSIGYSSITDQEVAMLLQDLGKLQNLQTLRIDLSNSKKITDFTLHAVSQTLLYLKNSLQKVYLVFENCQSLTNMSIKSLADVIQELVHLRILVLSFEQDQLLDDKGLAWLSNSFQEGLKELELYFGECPEISDKGVAFMTKNLPSSLEKLSIGLEFCKKVKDNGLITLGNRLQFLTHLEDLKLILESCIEITQEGLDSLFSKLVNLKQLRNIELYLQDCSKVDGVCLIKLAIHIGQIDSLRNLSLQFEGCKKITDQSLIGLSQALTKLHQLQSLTLSFMLCSLITDQSLDFLSQNIPQIQTLKELMLDFRMCSNLTKVGMSYFFQRLPSNEVLEKKMFF